MSARARRHDARQAAAAAAASSAPAAMATGIEAGSCWLSTGPDMPASDSTSGTRTSAVSERMPSTALLVSASARALRTSSQAAAAGGSRPASGRHAAAASSGITRGHWQRARDRWDQLSRHHPGQAVQPWLARIVDLDDHDFTTLLVATTWFRANPRSGLTVRSVPVPGMHTKWLARHRSMVIACLGTLTDPGESAEPLEDPDPAGDLDALGLRPLPREISIVIADRVLRAATGGLRQITAPVNELAALQIKPDAILIVENKEPAVTWSDTAGLVVIHSLGNHLDVLSLLPWICPDSCWYWGDLDRHGFTLLSRARTMIPQLESLLMTPGDIETYRPLGVEEKLDRYDQPDSTLTPPEARALAALQLAGGKYLRTEQERIPVIDAECALEQAVNLARPNVTGPSH